MVGCSILGCNSRSERKLDKLTFHSFPSNTEIKMKWLDATGRKHWEPSQYSKICSNHFDIHSFIYKNKIVQLKPFSFPTKHIHASSSTVNVNTPLKQPASQEVFKSTSKKRHFGKLLLKEKFKSERKQTIRGKSQSSSRDFSNSSEDFIGTMKELITSTNESNTLLQDDLTLECRACYQKFDYDGGLINLFQSWNPPWNGMADTIAEDLINLTSIEISTTDAFSKHICLMCHQKLLDACNFVANVRLNDRVFREKAEQFSRQETIWPKPIQVDKDVNSLIRDNSMVVEVKQEVLSEEEPDVNSTDDIYKDSDFNNLDIKVEPEEIVEQPPIQITVNGTITHDQFAQNSMLANGDCKPDDKNFDIANDGVKVKEEPQSEDEDTELVPDLPLECMLCTKKFNSVSGLKAHVVSQHSYVSVKRKNDGGGSSPKKKDKHVCATCRCSFETSTDLMVHETRHNAYACYVCNAKFDTFELLTKHRKKCKQSDRKTLQRPKTLEDVQRPQVSSPRLSGKSTPECMNDKQNEKLRTSSSVEVHLKIHSLSEQTNIAGSENGIEMKVEPLDSSNSSVSEDEVTS